MKGIEATLSEGQSEPEVAPSPEINLPFRAETSFVLPIFRNAIVIKAGRYACSKEPIACSKSKEPEKPNCKDKKIVAPFRAGGQMRDHLGGLAEAR